MVAGQPKRVKQDISTYLTTAENLKQQGQPLKSAYTGVVGAMAKDSEKAGAGALQKQAEVQQKTSPDTLKSNVAQVDTSAWKVSPVSVKPVSTDTTDVTGYLSDVGSAKTEASTKVGEQATAAKEGISGAFSSAREETSKKLQEVDQYLSQGTGRNIDAAGQIVGSNVSIGKTAAPSIFETGALGVEETLAGGLGSSSNIDALRAMLGMTYDPRLAGLTSQVYQGDIAQARGEAQQALTDRERAESFRTSALEKYLGELPEGQKRVGTAREEADKAYTSQQTEAEKRLEAEREAAMQQIESEAGALGGKVGEVQNRANIEKVKQDEARAEAVVKNLAPNLEGGIAKFFQNRPNLQGKYTAERLVDELLAGASFEGANLRGIAGSLAEIDKAIKGTQVSGYSPKTTRDFLLQIVAPIAQRYGAPISQKQEYTGKGGRSLESAAPAQPEDMTNMPDAGDWFSKRMRESLGLDKMERMA